MANPGAMFTADGDLADPPAPGPGTARILLATVGVGVPMVESVQLAQAVAAKARELGYLDVVVHDESVSATREDVHTPRPAETCPDCLRQISKYPNTGRFYRHHCSRPGEWRIELPYRELLLNENMRLNTFEKARRVRQLRRDAYLLARSQKLPRQLKRCEVVLHWQPAVRRPRDVDNPTPTLKALCDGLTDAGVVVDDTHDRMRKRVEIHDPEPGQKGAELWLVITGITDRPTS